MKVDSRISAEMHTAFSNQLNISMTGNMQQKEKNSYICLPPNLTNLKKKCSTFTYNWFSTAYTNNTFIITATKQTNKSNTNLHTQNNSTLTSNFNF